MSGAKTAGIWMPVYIKDRRAEVSTMSHVEHSAYSYLMMLFWERGGVIQDDDAAIAKALRLTQKKWKSVRTALLTDCYISGGQIHHEWTVKEVMKANVNIEQKRKAGIASARARHGNGCSTAVTTAVQPRAGEGEGEGVLAERDPLLGIGEEGAERNPFDVIRGGRP